MSVHYAPHLGAAFEGYYNKFTLPSGASVLLIISAVPAAARQAHQGRKRPSDCRAFMISFTYVSADGTEWWQRHYYPEELDLDADSPKKGETQGFITRWDTGEFSWSNSTRDGEERDMLRWRLETEEVVFSAETTLRPDDQSKRSLGAREPWRPFDRSSTPAGLVAYLPLPIQWHVHTLDSPTVFELKFRPERLDKGKLVDRHESSPTVLSSNPPPASGTARVHAEKNWAVSFPRSYIWMQARNHDRNVGINLAGGELFPGAEAWLVGYTGTAVPFVSFKPPTSAALFHYGFGFGGMDSKIDRDKRTVVLQLTGWFKRIRISARAPRNSFFDLCAPLPTGHAPGYCGQSFAAIIEVEVWGRSWPWQGWTRLEKETFERASLEFGGSFYTAEAE